MKYLLLGLLLGVSMARADDVESLHIANINFDFKPGWTLQLHTRGRTFEHMGSRNQVRGGPILMWQAKRRFTLLTGYYYINQAVRQSDRSYSVQRYWGGGQYRLYRAESSSLDVRTLLERHSSGEFKDYWRSRSRAMYSWRTRVGMPYISGEALVQQSHWYGRYTGGLQWKVASNVILGAGYEYRQAASGPGSHIIATFFQWSAYRHTPPHID